MTTKIAVLLLCASLLPATQALAKSKAILPDACGDDNIKFNIKTETDQSPSVPPPAGKAQIVFIEDAGVIAAAFTRNAAFRYAIDGSWVGATRDNSYFVLNVEPGIHQICISPQSPSKALNASIQIASLNAEPGKVYYLSAQFTLGSAVPTNPSSGANTDAASGGALQNQGFGTNFINLFQLSDAVGKYRIKAWKLATWKADK